MATDPDPDLRERVAELEATVEAQQATIQQLLPSRRRVLQAGGLLAGGGVLGALSADRASADVTGQIGTQQDRVDVFAGDVDSNSVSTGDLSRTSDSPILIGSVGRREDFDGADADERLDNALSDATDGDTIFLESAEYSDNRSITTRVLLQGSSAPFRGTLLAGTWTLNDFIKLRDIDGSAGGSVTVASARCELSSCSVLDIQVDADRARVLGQEGGSVTFTSGTSECIVDSCRGTSVTDNGSNTIGDIS